MGVFVILLAKGTSAGYTVIWYIIRYMRMSNKVLQIRVCRDDADGICDVKRCLCH